MKKVEYTKITCKNCHKAYVGQTSRNLKSRFRKHTRYIKNNDPRSAYARHILNCRHEYGNINDTMTLLKQINHKPSSFHMNRCTSSRSTIIMNSSLNNIPIKIMLCLASFIQILHVITHLTPKPQSHAFHPVLSQSVHRTVTYRVSTL